MDEKKPLLERAAQSPRDPFVVNSLNYSNEFQDGSLNVLAQHSRYKYYAKLHTKEKLVCFLLLYYDIFLENLLHACKMLHGQLLACFASLLHNLHKQWENNVSHDLDPAIATCPCKRQTFKSVAEQRFIRKDEKVNITILPNLHIDWFIKWNCCKKQACSLFSLMQLRV